MAERKRKGGCWKRRPVLPADACDRPRALNELPRGFAVVRVTSRPVVVARRAGGLVSCSRPDLERLLDNLIENALRHTCVGSEVTLAVDARGRHVVLEVTDQGEGIPSDELPYIFDRFYRARSSDGMRGSGLGLAIVKAIVESHHGQVDIETLPGIGTSFRVDLPGFQPEPVTRLAPLAARTAYASSGAVGRADSPLRTVRVKRIESDT